MFVRTQSHQRKNGTSIPVFALAESRRVDGNPRTFNLLNLGPDFKIPQELWKDFGKQVKSYLKGTSSLEAYEEGFRQTVIATADQLEADGYDVHAKPNQHHWIIPEQMSHPDSRTVGGERVGLKALQLMGFAELLLELGLSQEQIHTARMLVIGRMLSPGSEKKTHQWMRDESSIAELLGCKSPSLSSLYRCSDRLHKHHKTITKRLFSNTKELLGFGHTIVFYDLTNTYFHGRKQGELREHGRSKEKRSDCPLVTLALSINEAGFPCNVDILPGNVGESKTLQAALENLDVDGVTVIMDAGISTKENLAYLDQHGYAWITVDRRKKPPAPRRTPDEEFETTSGVKLRAWDLQSDRNGDEDQQHEESLKIQSDGDQIIKERFIYIHSEAKEGKEKAIMDAKCKKFEEALEDLHVGLSLPRRMKNFVLVEQKVGRLKKEFSMVSHLYDIKVSPKEGTDHAASVVYHRSERYDERQAFIGGYVIRTSLTDWDLQTTVEHYHRLTEIEATFRVMNSDLGLRPIYHQDDGRIEGHMFITVLAYYAAHLVRTLLKQNHIHYSWETLRTHLNRVRRVTTKLPKTKQRYLLTHIDEDIPEFVEDIMDCIGLNYDPKNTRCIEERTE